MGDVRQLPELERQFQNLSLKMTNLRDETAQLLVDNPTGDLPIDVVRRIIAIERSISRMLVELKTNAGLQEQRHVDATSDPSLIEKVWDELGKAEEAHDMALSNILILRRRDPGLKTPPSSSSATHGVPAGPSRAPDPLSSVIKLPPQELQQFRVYSQCIQTGRAFGTATSLQFTRELDFQT